MVHPLYRDNTALVQKLATGLSDDLTTLFEQRAKRWPNIFMHDECFTIGAFDDLMQNILTARAFQLIPIAINIALEQTSSRLLLFSLYLILHLAAASETTEIQPILTENYEILTQKIGSFPDNEELQSYGESIKK